MFTYFRQASRQQTVAAHREHDTRQAEQQHHNHGGQADHDAQRNDFRRPGGPRQLEAGGQGRTVRLGKLFIGDHTGRDHGDQHVQHGDQTHAQGDAARYVAARVLGLLRGGGDHVEAQEGEEHERRARQNTRHAVDSGLHTGHPLPQRLHHRPARRRAAHARSRLFRRDERREIARFDIEETNNDNEQHDANLQHRQRAVNARGQPGAEHQQHGEERHNHQRGEVDGQSANMHLRGGVPADQMQEVIQIDAPVFRDDRTGHEHLEDQIPADNPGDQLPHRRVGEGICGPGDRDHRRELRIAHDGRTAHDTGNQKAQNRRRTRMIGDRLGAHGEYARADRDRDTHHRQIPHTERAHQLALAVACFRERLLN